jgi:hypothetical protein
VPKINHWDIYQVNLSYVHNVLCLSTKIDSHQNASIFYVRIEAFWCKKSKLGELVVPWNKKFAPYLFNNLIYKIRLEVPEFIYSGLRVHMYSIRVCPRALLLCKIIYCIYTSNIYHFKLQRALPV